MMCSIPIPILIPIQFSFAWELYGNPIPMGTLIPIMGMRVPMGTLIPMMGMRVPITMGTLIPIMGVGTVGTMGTLIPMMGMRVPMGMGIPCTPLVTINCKRGDQKNTRRLVTAV